jgi:GNAT superfamily N-acetyltransferase
MQFTVFHLEMFQPPERVVPPPRDGLIVMQARLPTLHFYRYLYDAVGRDWNWTRRKSWSDEELAAVVQHPQNELHVLYADGVPAGFAELDFRNPADVELVQFGLVPEFIGQGLGTYFLNWVLDFVWRRRPNRFWLHTCTMDHPRALSNYLKAGFTIYREETRTR